MGFGLRLFGFLQLVGSPRSLLVRRFSLRIVFVLVLRVVLLGRVALGRSLGQRIEYRLVEQTLIQSRRHEEIAARRLRFLGRRRDLVAVLRPLYFARHGRAIAEPEQVFHAVFHADDGLAVARDDVPLLESEEAPLRQRRHGLAVTGELLLGLEVGAETGWLPDHIHNLEVAQRVSEVVELAGCELLVVRELVNLELVLVVKALELQERPLRIFVVVGQLRAGVAVEGYRQPPRRLVGAEGAGRVVERELPHVPGREFEQILFNPVVKQRAELGRVEFDAIDAVLPSPPHEPQRSAAGCRHARRTLVLLADDQPRKLVA